MTDPSCVCVCVCVCVWDGLDSRELHEEEQNRAAFITSTILQSRSRQMIFMSSQQKYLRV